METGKTKTSRVKIGCLLFFLILVICIYILFVSYPITYILAKDVLKRISGQENDIEVAMSFLSDKRKSEINRSITELSINNKIPDIKPASLELFLLVNGKYDELEQHMVSLQSEYEKDYLKESYIEDAFLIFQDVDHPGIMAYLDRWAEFSPKSYAALVSRGIYKYNLAWKIRGSQYSSKTSKARLVKMKEYITSSARDLVAATKINPRVSVAYSYLIRTQMTLGNNGVKNIYYKQGTFNDPYSVVIHRAYQHSLQSQWGGSWQELSDMTTEALRHTDKNPSLKRLRASLHVYAADAHLRKRKNDMALTEYLAAVRASDHPYYAFELADYYMKHRLYAEAVGLLDKAINLYSDNAELLNKRSKAYMKLQNYDGASRDINRAISFNPYNADSHKTQGYLNIELRKYDAAVADFHVAITMQPFDADAWMESGLIYARMLNNKEQALNNIETAIYIKPSIKESWYVYGAVLHNAKDKRAVSILRAYENNCTVWDCIEHNRLWARNFLSCADRDPDCPYGLGQFEYLQVESKQTP